MRREEIRVGVLRIEGTNMEDEAASAFISSGAAAEHVHLKQLEGRCRSSMRRDIFDFQMLVIPGGFSAGDYIRAGAIFASRIKSAVSRKLFDFIDEGRPVLGICNGFQVLVELGILPCGDVRSEFLPRAALSTNLSTRYECRPAFLRNEDRGHCIFTRRMRHGEIISVPTAHGEGRLTFPPEREEEWIKKLIETDQIVFRYVDREGNYAPYPWNPNGSTFNIAGLTDDTGCVLGMMPHPERTYWNYLHQDWTRGRDPSGFGEGQAIIEGALEYIEASF